MPDINLVSISPSQMIGSGESGPYDVSMFERKYLAQGDSWFSIGHIPPWSTTNLLQQMVLSRSAVAVNCARPGVELSHMTDTSTSQVFLNLLNGHIAWKWDAILMSGGGNDLIDAANTDPSQDPDVRVLLRADEWQASAPAPGRYVSESGWNTFTSHMEDVLKLLLDQRDKGINKGVPLLLHTYDHVTPRNAPAGPHLGPWLYKAMNDQYQVPPSDWNSLADALIDGLATMWLALAAKYSDQQITIVDSRGSTVRAVAGTSGMSNDWENEIHPTPQGYGKLDGGWRSALDALG